MSDASSQDSNRPPAQRNGNVESGGETTQDPAVWSRVKALFQTVVELPEAQREAHLRSAAEREDPTVLEQVRRMLAADAPDRFLESAPSVPPGSANLAEGARIGAYCIARRLGEGGMGTVYLAERADGAFDKQVAVKVINPGGDAGPILDRFERERQVLAHLEHPNIARLLDGGTTDDGAPYLVMEYVDGMPIDQFCDERALSIRRRLELFRNVCEAVQFAHRNLVIHRDLKPGNIMVTADGQVKLLDFGIAKVLDGAMARTDVTVTMQRPMTPRYASPEQIRGEPITTATDVYALGAVLYELLTGRGPYGWSPKTQGELERVVCEAEPRRPSRSVTSETTLDSRSADDAPSPEELARRRSMRVNQLQRVLRGDLDNIVLMALRKEPHRRYQSAEQFSDDIERTLQGFPVRARPETLAYRAQKFVRRNTLLVSSAAAVLIVSVTAAILSTNFALETKQAEARAQAEAVEAQRQAAVANAVNAFLQRILEQADPMKNPRGKDLTLHEAVELAGGLVEESFTEQPDVESAVRFTLGVVDLNLGRLDSSVQQLEQALALARQHHGEAHRQTLHSRAQLGLALIRLGRLDEAQRVLEAGLDEARAAPQQDWDVAAQIDNQLGLLHLNRGDGAAAQPHLRAAAECKAVVHGDHHSETLTTLHNLSGSLWMQGQRDEALTLARDILDRRREVLQAFHPDVAQSLNTVAYMLTQMERYEDALPLRDDDLAMRRSLYDDDHPDLARSMHNMAHLLHLMGRSDEALPMQQDAVAMWQRTLPAEHRDVARGHSVLAAILDALGRDDEAARVREAMQQLDAGDE